MAYFIALPSDITVEGVAKKFLSKILLRAVPITGNVLSHWNLVIGSKTTHQPITYVIGPDHHDRYPIIGNATDQCSWHPIRTSALFVYKEPIFTVESRSSSVNSTTHL